LEEEMRRLPIIIALAILFSGICHQAIAKNTPKKRFAPADAESARIIAKEGRQLLEISKGSIIRLDGAGKLKFKREGQIIEIPSGLSIMINGKPVNQVNTAVHVGEKVQIVDSKKKTVWNLSLTTDPRIPGVQSEWTEMDIGNSAGEFTLSYNEPVTIFLQSRPGGKFRMRTIAGLILEDSGLTN
jgi:hypothetical protein